MANAPGVSIREVDVFRTVEGVPVDVAAAFGITQRGPDDELRLVISLDDFINKYGGFYAGSYLPYLVRGFFEQGGTALYIGRCVGSGAAKATGDALAQGGLLKTVDIDGRHFGEYANSILVDFTRVTTALSTATAAIDTSIVVDSIGQFELGDVIYIDDGTNTYQGIVVGLDAGTKTIDLSLAVGAIFAIGVEVKTASSHRAKTATTSVFAAASTSVQFTVSNALNIRIGDLVMVMDGDLGGNYMFTELKVTGVNGSTIFADVENEAVSGLTEMPIGAPVIVQNFNVYVSYEGAVKTYFHVSLESENQVDYVDERLGGDRNESDLIEMVDSGNTETVAWRVLQYPAPVGVGLTGGADGAAPADIDYLGTNPAKTYKHGIQLMDENYQIATFAIPGVTTAATITGADSYAKGKKLDFVGDCPLAADTLDELLEFRNLTLGIDSSYSAIYAPWINEENPLIPGALVSLPPSCRQLGVHSSVSAREGVHKAPANYVYLNVVSLQADFSETEHGILNEAGVNLIRIFPGRGIRVYGARTLYSGRDGKQFINVRRLANYVERSISNLAFDFTFDTITEVLWAKLQGSIDRFLRGLWKAGMLYPRNDSTKAFMVIINEGLNPPDVIREGRVRGKVAFSPAPPAERIELDVALWAGNSEIIE